jgi:flagellar basal body-associated protein FliL
MSTEEAKSNDEKKPEGGAAPAPRSKKGMWLGGGAMSMVALAWALSLVAVPAKESEMAPAEHGVTLLNVSPQGGFQVNLGGIGGNHYLAMKVMTEIVAHDSASVVERANDPLYEAKLSDAVLKVSSRKTKTDLDDTFGKEVFREELRAAIERVLFPVHVGNEVKPTERHTESGIGPGISIEMSTLRGAFREHALTVDAATKTIELDGGIPVHFEGRETDLEVRGQGGDVVYVDVSRVERGFHGEVHVGVLGSVQSVYFTAFLIQ